jgi:hypothetical protein
MIGARILLMSIAWVTISSSVLSAPDLSRYREFRLGMSLLAVAQQAGITPEARVLHHPPELIQELVWHRPRSLGSSSRGESARKVLFSFYDGLLFRIAVNYEWDRTEGLTVDDMVEALSVTYGPALLLAADTIPSLSRVDTDGDRIVARWDDPEHSLTLVRPLYASTFGLVLVSKRLEALVHAASVEPIRRDEQGAPRRAIERKQKQEAEDHARQEKVRLVNKAAFRP